MKNKNSDAPLMFSEKNHEKNKVNKKFITTLGSVVSILSNANEYQKVPLAYLRVCIMPAIRLGQIEIVYAYDGFPLAYFAWAWLTEDAERKWINEPGVLKNISDWTSGDNLWIVDFAALSGSSRQVIGYIRKNCLLDQHLAKSIRRGIDGSPSRIVKWRRKLN